MEVLAHFVAGVIAGQMGIAAMAILGWLIIGISCWIFSQDI